MKIDMVFTYCDGRDPMFASEKNKYLKKEFEKNNPSIRHNNINEITYSVKSVLKFIPWINKIYIITHKQIPPIELHPKVMIVDHTQIIPKQYLPTFNSTVIESFIHNIPDLSEIFLYNNDDVMHTNYIDQNDVIHDNKIIFRNTYREPNELLNEFSKRISLTSKILRMKNPQIELINNHNTKILRKSTLKFIECKYPKLLHDMRINRFRKDDYIEYLFFALNIDNVLNENIILNKCKDTLFIGLLNINYSDDIFLKIIHKRPKFMCLNDMNETFQIPFQNLMQHILN